MHPFAPAGGLALDEGDEDPLGEEVPGEQVNERGRARPFRIACAAIVTGLQFAKSMTWGAGFRFARPVRWICAITSGGNAPLRRCASIGRFIG